MKAPNMSKEEDRAVRKLIRDGLPAGVLAIIGRIYDTTFVGAESRQIVIDLAEGRMDSDQFVAIARYMES